MIQLTNWFNKKPVYVNENRLALVEGVYTDEGEMTKTRVCCPKPIYVSETPEEVVAKIKASRLQLVFEGGEAVCAGA